jgi:hypothetical protein
MAPADGAGDGPEGNQVATPEATVARRVRDLLCPEDHPEPSAHRYWLRSRPRSTLPRCVRGKSARNTISRGAL